MISTGPARATAGVTRATGPAGAGGTWGGGPLPASPAVSAECGELRPGRGVVLRWPDGETTEVIAGAVTGLGIA